MLLVGLLAGSASPLERRLHRPYGAEGGAHCVSDVVRREMAVVLLDHAHIGVTKLRRDADPHHLKGLHPTGVFGGIAAAAACANLLGLDAERAARAIGIAASQAAGLVANFGSMAKPFHAGRAAQVGVMSARLAKQGMTAAPDVIEQPKGFLHVVSPRGAVDLASPPMFGREWWILRNGLGFKLYPMCYGAHRSLDGMLALVTEHGIAAAQKIRSLLEEQQSGDSQQRRLTQFRSRRLFDA